MFETYQFSGVYIAIQAVLTLYAQGMRSNFCQIIVLAHQAVPKEKQKSRLGLFLNFVATKRW